MNSEQTTENKPVNTNLVPALMLDHVSKWYGNIVGLNDVSIAINGGVTGLLGMNGAGKSTLFKLIVGKLKPSQAHWLIRYFVPKNGRIIDPLGGVGTIPFEAALQGYDAVSNDKSPFASIIGAAKMNAPTKSEALATL